MAGPGWADETALLQAMLTGDASTQQRLLAELQRRDNCERLGVLLAAAFAVAVRRHLQDGYTAPDVIRLVARIRATAGGAAAGIDPSGAERVVRAALGEPGPVSDVDDQTKGSIQTLGLMFLIADQEPDGDQLTAFLATAQRQATLLIAAPPLA